MNADNLGFMPICQFAYWASGRFRESRSKSVSICVHLRFNVFFVFMLLTNLCNLWFKISGRQKP